MLALVACAGVRPGGDFNVLSIDEEWRLGERLEAEQRNRVELVRDAAALAVLDRMTRLLADAGELAGEAWSVHLVDEAAVSLLTLPGGQLYVSVGLVERTTDVSELAGALAHALAHGVARHGSERLSEAYGVALLGELELGQDRDAYRELLDSLAAGGSLARHSLAEEREADRLALELLAAAGYAPEGLLRFWRAVDAAESGDATPRELLAAHPFPADRLETLARELEALGAATAPESARDEAGYRRLRARLPDIARSSAGGRP